MSSRSRRLLSAIVALVVATALGTIPAVAASTDRPWMDKSQSPDTRARMILAQMTLAEKVDLRPATRARRPTRTTTRRSCAWASRR